jgi:hypothetical protein
MAGMLTTKELAARLKKKHAKGKAGRPKLRTVPVTVGADKSVAALIKDAQEKPTGGSFFKFEAPGDVIAGTFISAKEEDGKFGPQLQVTVDTKEGPRMFSCTSSLAELLVDEGVAIGTGSGKGRSFSGNPKMRGKKLAVVFRGSRPSGRGHPFKLFAVAVK